MVFAEINMSKPAANSSALLAWEYALLKPSVKAGTSVQELSAYLASSLTVDLLSAALSLSPQEEGHLVRGSCVR